jgi:hypothetical protein
MQRYIEQLIDDIHKATWNLKPPHSLWEESEADPDNELELEDMSFVEQYIEGEKQPIAQITGIGAEQLPPSEKLAIEQRALLAVELEKLLQYFHFVLDFPATLPGHLRYPFIRDFWSEEHVPLSFGENHIEFCDYEVEHCPFPGYCTTCKEVEAQMKYDEERDATGDFDFDFDVDSLLPDLEQLEDIWDARDKIENDDEPDDDPDPNDHSPS